MIGTLDQALVTDLKKKFDRNIRSNSIRCQIWKMSFLTLLNHNIPHRWFIMIISLNVIALTLTLPMVFLLSKHQLLLLIIMKHNSPCLITMYPGAHMMTELDFSNKYLLEGLFFMYHKPAVNQAQRSPLYLKSSLSLPIHISKIF